MATSTPGDITGLAEIRALLADLPGPDEEAAAAAAARQAELTKPTGALGRLERLTEWLAAWQGRHPPQVERPHAAVFAANHGVAVHGVSAYPTEVTAQMVQAFIDGKAAINQICGLIGAELRVYEMALDEPTRDFSEHEAMDDEDCARAMAYGMMAIEEGYDVYVLGEMGIGNTTSSAAICQALFDGRPEDWCGRGTGVSDNILGLKAEIVGRSVALHRDAMIDPFEVLRCVGGLEIAAIAGAILAARLARVPVVLDGFTSTAAAAVLYAADKRAIDHCVVGHLSAEHAHSRLVHRIGKKPLLDLEMRLGEGSGAATAVMLLKAACACHNGMATFSEAGVSGRAENA